MYKIHSHPIDDFIAGTCDNNRQALMGLLYPYVVMVFFSAEGKLVEILLRPLPFQAKSGGERGPYLLEEPDFQQKLEDYLLERQKDIDFTEVTIHVELFMIPCLSLGIENLPRHLQEFLRDPGDFSDEEKLNYPEIIERWKQQNDFVLWWGKDYYLNRKGEII